MHAFSRYRNIFRIFTRGQKIERVSTLSRLKGEACLSQYQTLGSGYWCVVGHISTTRCASSGWEWVHEEAAISEYDDPNLLYVCTYSTSSDPRIIR